MQFGIFAFLAVMLCQILAAGSILFQWFGPLGLVVLIGAFIFCVSARVVLQTLIPFLGILAFIGAHKVWEWPIWASFIIAVPAVLILVPVIFVAIVGAIFEGNKKDGVEFPQSAVKNQIPPPLPVVPPTIKHQPTPTASVSEKQQVPFFLLVYLIFVVVVGGAVLIGPPGDNTVIHNTPHQAASSSDVISQSEEAGSLYAKAKSAFDAKDYPTTLTYLRDVLSKFPDTPEGRAADKSVAGVTEMYQKQQNNIASQVIAEAKIKKEIDLENKWAYSKSGEYVELFHRMSEEFNGKIASDGKNAQLMIEHFGLVGADRSILVVYLLFRTEQTRPECSMKGSLCTYWIKTNGGGSLTPLAVKAEGYSDSDGLYIFSVMGDGVGADLVARLPDIESLEVNPASPSGIPDWVTFTPSGIKLDKIGLTKSQAQLIAANERGKAKPFMEKEDTNTDTDTDTEDQ